jgi:hypothetical protein
MRRYAQQRACWQAMREKIVDWLRANVPRGFEPKLPQTERQEKWLYSYCHDEDYRLTDAALNYMLVVMHIVSVDPVKMLQSRENDRSPVRFRWAGHLVQESGAAWTNRHASMTLIAVVVHARIHMVHGVLYDGCPRCTFALS